MKLFIYRASQWPGATTDIVAICTAKTRVTADAIVSRKHKFLAKVLDGDQKYKYAHLQVEEFDPLNTKIIFLDHQKKDDPDITY